MLGICDGKSGMLKRSFPLGEGIDNHCGAALALDGDGRVHAVVGAHHSPFLYRWSDRPGNPESWSEPVALGPEDTYPSLAVDRSGTLHLAHRAKGDRWQLWYRRKQPGNDWEPPVALATSPTKGYNHFMQSLTVGPGDSLHLVFQFHYAESGHAADCQGRAAVYLWSDDGGDTWVNEGQRCDDLPLTVETMRPICHCPQGGVRIGNHVVDEQGQVWLYSAFPGSTGGMLWCRTSGGWEGHDLGNRIQPLNLLGPRSTSLSRDAEGYLHLVFAADPLGGETPWFDPRHELFHAVVDRNGALRNPTQLTETDPAVAQWIPAVEALDWNRPDACRSNGLWMAYTRGLNAGGIGGDNRNAVETEVYLRRLPMSVVPTM